MVVKGLRRGRGGRSFTVVKGKKEALGGKRAQAAFPGQITGKIEVLSR
jgi:hypothetical protein